MKFRGVRSIGPAKNAETLGLGGPIVVVTRGLHDGWTATRGQLRRSSHFSTPGKKLRRFKMKLTNLFAALLIAVSANIANAGLFGHHGGGYGCCAPAPTCCDVAPSCAAPCDPCCAAPCAPACNPVCAAPCNTGCDPVCAAPCAPECCAPAAPACCAPAPAACCAPVSCCAPRKHRLMGWFKGLRHSHKADCCYEAPSCCAPACEASCAAPCAPNCAAPCNGCY